MLFEQITYPEDFPFRIQVAEASEYPLHYHQDIEFVIVLAGSISLTNGYCSYTLKEGDVFTNAGHEVHAIRADGAENVIAVMQISTRFFSQYFPDLSKACYRTYASGPHTKEQEILREKLLQILQLYYVRSLNYRTECVYGMVEVLKFLNRHFNLFAFEGKVVVNSQSGDQITMDRISRIIRYIYEFHADHIKLDDLARMEHLSPFYLSHIIKDYTGMNFRDFLCFARVEWSIIDLLETKDRISRIALNRGFSTTAYYEKYFRRWFGMDPQTYREKNLPRTLSDTNPGRMRELERGETERLIHQTLSRSNAENRSGSLVNQLRFEIAFSASSEASDTFAAEVHVSVRLQDFRALGYRIFSLIRDLHPAKVLLLVGREDDPAELDRFSDALMREGCAVEQVLPRGQESFCSYAFDSIAYPIFLMQRQIRDPKRIVTLPLRDQKTGPDNRILAGSPALISDGGICKPIYYACQMLSVLKGDILLTGRQHCVIRSSRNGQTIYAVFAMNYNDEIYSLCKEEQTARNVKNVLYEFKDEMDLSVNMTLPPGMYTVARYSLPMNRGIFAHMAALGFPRDDRFFREHPELMETQPDMEVSVEDIRATFNLNFLIKGAGMQYALIIPEQDGKEH